MKTDSTTLIASGALDSALDYLDDMPHVTNWYSGRAMYGAYCFGIVFDGGDSDLIKFYLDLARDDRDLADELRNAQRSDNMGLRTIYYWPGFRVDGKSRYRDRDEDEMEAYDVEEEGL